MSSGPAVVDCLVSFCSSSGLSIASVRVAGGPPSPGGWLNSDVVGSGPSGSEAAWEPAGRMSGRFAFSVGAASEGSGAGLVISGAALSGFSLERSDAPVVVPGVIGAAS